MSFAISAINRLWQNANAKGPIERIESVISIAFKPVQRATTQCPIELMEFDIVRGNGPGSMLS